MDDDCSGQAWDAEYHHLLLAMGECGRVERRAIAQMRMDARDAPVAIVECDDPAVHHVREAVAGAAGRRVLGLILL